MAGPGRYEQLNGEGRPGGGCMLCMLFARELSSVKGMRLGVLDVGSNTVHLLVVDAHRGARPLPAFSHKAELRLGDHLDAANRLSDGCAAQLRAFVDEALRIAEDKGVQELLAFATSAVRDAANGDEVLALFEAETKVHIQVLAGHYE